MNSKNRNVIFIGISAFLMVLFHSSARGEIYKWQDGNGKTHYSDNLLDIPREFRTESHLEPMRLKGLVKPEESTDIKVKNQASGNKPKKVAKKADKKKAISENERKALESAIFFLNNNINAYHKYFDHAPDETVFKAIKYITENSMKPKNKLIMRLSRFKSPIAQETMKFLESSLEKDDDVKKSVVHVKSNTKSLLARFKKESKTKTLMVQKIKAVLAAAKS